MPTCYADASVCQASLEVSADAIKETSVGEREPNNGIKDELILKGPKSIIGIDSGGVVFGKGRHGTWFGAIINKTKEIIAHNNSVKL